MKAYLATNFFNEATFDWTAKIGEKFRALGIDIYIPQENGEINDKSSDTAASVTDIDIANGDNKYLESSNILIASLDGVEIDSGVSAEIGYFSGLARGEELYCAHPPFRTIVGIYTDIRRDGEGDNRFYINLYTKGLVKLRGKVVHSSQEAYDLLFEVLKEVKKQEQIGRKI